MRKRILALVVGLCLISSFVYAEYPGFSGLSEIIGERTYNQKVFDNSTQKQGSKRYRIHCKHIHYKEANKFEDINTVLTWDSLNKVWKHNKASYHPQIPEYADDWFEFYNAYEGVNHTIKARPIASHIKGVLGTVDEEDGLGHDWVLYKDAFGAGIDLKVATTWSGMKKVIRINKKPFDTSQDLVFDFELELPLNSDVLDKENSKWDKKSKLKFKDKVLRIGKDNKFSYFRNANIWDSGELNEPVNIELYIKASKIYLRKTITKEFLQKAVYPLYTDHPTSYYVGSGVDGSVTYSNTSANDWDGTHDAITGTAVKYTPSPSYCGAAVYTSASFHQYYYRIRRLFVPIDTSGIGGETVTGATFYIYADGKVNQDNDGEDYVNIVQTTQDPTALAVEDYDLCGSVDTPTIGCDTNVDIGDIATDDYTTFILNDLTWVITDGYTMLGVREGHDILDHVIAAPPDGQAKTNRVHWRTEEYANTGSDPYLDVTVSVTAAVMQPIINLF